MSFSQQQVPEDFSPQQQHQQRALFDQQGVQHQFSGESQRQAPQQNLYSYQANHQLYAHQQDGGQMQTTSQAQHLADPQQRVSELRVLASDHQLRCTGIMCDFASRVYNVYLFDSHLINFAGLSNAPIVGPTTARK